MNRRKTNNRLWYILALSVLLCICALVLMTGMSFARYQKETKKLLTFEVASPARLYLGTETVETVQPEEGDDAEATTVRSFKPGWDPVKTELGTGGMQQVQFAVSNGTSEEEYSSYKQQFTLQVVCTLGTTLQSESGEPIEAVKCWLRVPGEEEGSYTDYPGVAELIEEGTALGRDSGLGWVYTFYKDQETKTEELSWILNGGKLEYVALTLILEGQMSEMSLLMPHVIGTLLDNT